MPSLPEIPRNRRAEDDRTDLAALSRLARELSGTLRPPSIIQRLMSALDTHLNATASALSLYDIDTDRLEIMHGNPSGAPYLQELLDAGMRRGPIVLDAANIPGLPEEAPRAWLASPIVSKSVIIGALAVGRDEPSLGQDELNLLGAFVAQASLALESARLVDQVESGKRTWAEAVDAIPVPLCIIDRAGRVRRANLRFTELVRVPAESMTGRPWMALVPPSWREGITNVLEQGEGDVELRMDDEVWSLTAWPAGPADQGLTVLRFEDHRRQQQLREQLLQSQKLASVGQLVAGVAHDLNNPLASVLGFADFLAESPDVPDNLREPVKVIQEEAVHASHIVKNLLGFARKRDGSRRGTTVDSLIEGTLALLRNHLLAHHVEVSVEIEEDLPPVFVHSNRIQQALINLLTNAAHA
ncbi:MAG: histidine kinase dimerization/phospho-acceptor domain-containing protein, partial [Gemmatimonadales bacterium]